VPNDLAPPPSVEGSSCARTNPGPRQRTLNLPVFRERDWERPGLALVGHGDGKRVEQMAWWNECATAVIIAGSMRAAPEGEGVWGVAGTVRGGQIN